MIAAFTPAMWGVGGAFIYAGPRWIVALRGGASLILALLDLLICLGIGGVGAAAFGHLLSEVALTALHIADNNAACVVIGLFLNPLAPSVVEKGASALDGGASVLVRVLKALRGTSEK